VLVGGLVIHIYRDSVLKDLVGSEDLRDLTEWPEMRNWYLSPESSSETEDLVLCQESKDASEWRDSSEPPELDLNCLVDK
jgi:hypothetical protein